MFSKLFQWRKASKCKKLIKRARCRLKILKNKRSSIIRRLRSDLAQLLQLGHENIAFHRAEEIIRNEEIMILYDLLDQFCEFVLLHISYIWKNKDCPNDISEAISSIIYASARCGELPELRSIRTLFADHYGQRFSLSALELQPGNLVNSQVKEKLSGNTIRDEVKSRLLDEVARGNHLQSPPLMIEYSPKAEEERIEINSKSDSSIINDSPVHVVYLDDIEEIECPVFGGKVLEDQRAFRFKSVDENVFVNFQSVESGTDLPYNDTSSADREESRRFGKRTTSRSSTDIEYESYYGSSSSNSSIGNPRSRDLSRKKMNRRIEHSEVIRSLEYCLLVLKYWKYLPHSIGDDLMIEFERNPISGARSSSSPGYVHPKLPDCDELEEKFRALRREYLLKHHC